jgi:TolB-like protein
MSGEVPESGGGQPPSDPPTAVEVPKAPTRVFISYASQDATVAERLCAALEVAGLPCWIAPRDVRAGESYAAAIVQAINSCQMMVLVLSQGAIDSPHVLREVERASSKRRPVLSVRMDAAKLPPDLEYFLSANQWLDASGRPIEQIFPELVESVRNHETGMSGQALGAGAPAARSVSGPLWSPAPNKPSSHWGKRGVTVALAVAAVSLAYVLTSKLWLSKHVVSEQTKTAATNVVSDKSIAVLPFVDMSEKHDQEYFADGMAEEIIDLLAKVPDLRVPARTSSFYFKGKSTKVPDIAHELSVAHVLEGSIRRAGNRLRVTAQLVRADNGFHLWSQTYDRDLHDVFKVQDDIANAVVQALQITLMGGPLTRQQGGTQNLDAYQLYLRGVSAEMQNTKSSLESARGYLEQAIKLDPTFGLAWAWLAFNSMDQADSDYVLPTEGVPRARQQAQHALELSPDLVLPHCVLQWLYRTYDWDWPASEAEGRRALGVDPKNSRALMMAGLLSSTLGHGDDAERQERAALASDPLNTFAYFELGLVQYNAGRFASADASFRKLLDLAPDFEWTHTYLGKTLLAEGKPDEALAMVRLEAGEEDRLDFLPIMLQSTGHKAEAEEALKALTTKFSPTSAYFVAMSYAYRNDRDMALQWLDRAYKQQDAALAEIVGEPLFKNLASDPRYKAFLRKMNLPE